MTVVFFFFILMMFEHFEGHVGVSGTLFHFCDHQRVFEEPGREEGSLVFDIYSSQSDVEGGDLFFWGV